MSSNFALANREKLNLRIGVMGPTGSGKTRGMLLVAYGLCGDWSKVFLIDADNRSSLGYVNDTSSNIGRFMFAPMEPPFTPQRYLALIKEAAQPGNVVIIDTMSQEWAGEGGTLETHDQMSGNSYTNWGKVNPPHYELINYITLKAPCHMLVGLRTKIKHEQVEDPETGKKKIEILGDQPIARPGTEYEFQLTLLCDRDGFRATPITKRGTMLPDMRPVELTIELGRSLRAWAESGEIVENLAQSKQRLIKELREMAPEAYPDGASVATAMKKCVPPLVFSEAGQYEFIKAQLLLESAAKLVEGA